VPAWTPAQAANSSPASPALLRGGGCGSSGFRWSFYGTGDVSLGLSLGVTALFLVGSLAVVVWIFRTGYKLKA
jgi:hypothetical protein